MAVRTSSAAVGGIIEVDADISLTPFIEVANALVTECCGDVDDYDATRLELIERWLSAHFYTERDPRVKTEQAGSVRQENQSIVAIGFDNSHYGQMAMRIDTNGGLALLNEQIKNGSSGSKTITWLGTANPNLASN